jgi:hypothetical protein
MSDELEKVRAEDQDDFEAHRTHLDPAERVREEAGKKLGANRPKATDDDFEAHRVREHGVDRPREEAGRKLGAERPKGVSDDFEGHIMRVTGSDARLTDPDAPLR